MSRRADVLVIGGGLAGWTAAIECAKLGLSVRIFDDPKRSGAIATRDIAGVHGVDVGFETFAIGDSVHELAIDLGIEIETLLPRHTFFRTHRAIAPMPRRVLAGLPSNPFAKDLAPFLPGPPLRAYADRVMPLLRLGRFTSVANVARARFGQKVLSDLTTPWCEALYGLGPELVSLDRVAPTLNARMTQFGSASGAVASLGDSTARSVRLRDGATSLLLALRKRATEYLVDCVDEAVGRLDRTESEWRVRSESGEWTAPFVIAAVDPAQLGWDRVAGASDTVRNRLIVTAAVSVSRMPQATGILNAGDGSIVSAARPGARSERIRAELAEDTDLIRVVLDPLRMRAEDESAALTEAVAQLGGELKAVLEVDRTEWELLRPWVGLEDPEPGRPRTDETGSLEWTGQWASGPGGPEVVAHALEAARRIRRQALDAKVQSGS
ncbi:MAG TPA: NAD(P)-binding protein [Microbacteriaceae bacterium]|nr:NAD(P)-binding protein [Microbacteriaceae bacterium]